MHDWKTLRVLKINDNGEVGPSILDVRLDCNGLLRSKTDHCKTGYRLDKMDERPKSTHWDGMFGSQATSGYRSSVESWAIVAKKSDMDALIAGYLEEREQGRRHIMAKQEQALTESKLRLKSLYTKILT